MMRAAMLSWYGAAQNPRRFLRRGCTPLPSIARAGCLFDATPDDVTDAEYEEVEEA
jgi:hypothetical protein